MRFVQQILYGVQSTNLIKNIYEEAFTLVQAEAEARANFKVPPRHNGAQTLEVRAEKTGYVSAIHYEELSDKIEAFGGVMEIHTKIGEFTIEDARIATIYANQLPEDEVEVGSYFVIQDAKIPMVDYQHRKSQLIDITLKSLPPGKADLNNAIHCIRKINVLMAELMKVDGQFVSGGKEENNIFINVMPLEEELYTTYYQIVPSAGDQISVMIATFEGLYTMLRTATAQNKQLIEAFADTLYKRVEGNFSDPYDQKYLKRAYDKLK